MRKYAVKAQKGREYQYSKENIIDLGNNRTQKTLDKVIDVLNQLTQGTFVCNNNEIWRVCDDDFLCANLATYKMVVTKAGFTIKAIA